eukprot:c41113_g1_i1 orf=166-417(+)
MYGLSAVKTSYSYLKASEVAVMLVDQRADEQLPGTMNVASTISATWLLHQPADRTACPSARRVGTVQWHRECRIISENSSVAL